MVVIALKDDYSEYDVIRQLWDHKTHPWGNYGVAIECAIVASILLLFYGLYRLVWGRLEKWARSQVSPDPKAE